MKENLSYDEEIIEYKESDWYTGIYWEDRYLYIL